MPSQSPQADTRVKYLIDPEFHRQLWQHFSSPFQIVLGQALLAGFALWRILAQKRAGRVIENKP